MLLQPRSSRPEGLSENPLSRPARTSSPHRRPLSPRDRDLSSYLLADDYCGQPFPVVTKNCCDCWTHLSVAALIWRKRLIFTPFFAFWLATGTLLYRHDIAGRWIVPFQIGCVIVSITLAALYFVGYESATPANPGVRSIALAASRFVGMASGPVGGGTGRVFPGSAIGVLFCTAGCLLLASGIIPLRCGLRSVRSTERFRAFSMLIFRAAMATLTLLLAWGRAGWVPQFGMPSRYALLSVPGLCAVYFLWVLYGSDRMRNRAAVTFGVAALLALPFNVQKGLVGLHTYYVNGMRAVEQDLAEGATWREVADRHQKFLLAWDREALIMGMQMLHKARMGPWKGTGP